MRQHCDRICVFGMRGSLCVLPEFLHDLRGRTSGCSNIKRMFPVAFNDIRSLRLRGEGEDETRRGISFYTIIWIEHSMGDEGLTITTVEELTSLLGRAYWMETQLELSMQWESYVSVRDELRDVLFRISHDSEQHKLLVKNLWEQLSDTSLEQILSELHLKGKTFELKGKWDEEIINELMKNEHLAWDTYSKLFRYVDREFLASIWKGDNSEDFFKRLEYLIKEEEKHIALLKPYSGKLERIL